MASFYLSKELHLESRHPIVLQSDSAKHEKKSEYAVVYPNAVTISMVTLNSTDEVRKNDTNVSIIENKGKILSICNQIDSRKPFAIDSEDQSIGDYKQNDSELKNCLTAENHLELNNIHHENAPAWSSRINQYNPFLSNKDSYQKIPELSDV